MKDRQKQRENRRLKHYEEKLDTRNSYGAKDAHLSATDTAEYKSMIGKTMIRSRRALTRAKHDER